MESGIRNHDEQYDLDPEKNMIELSSNNRLHVNFNERLVDFLREVRQLTSMKYALPPAVLRHVQLVQKVGLSSKNVSVIERNKEREGEKEK